MQLALTDSSRVSIRTDTPKGQLLKWIGNKHRFAKEIVSYFPERFGTYFEPFVGSGAVLATLAPDKAIASDCFGPLIEIWQTLHENPTKLKRWYEERWRSAQNGEKESAYKAVRASYNGNPNGADLLFLCRTCYGGVVRFRQSDGYMSTPCGVHNPISPEAFTRRVDEWYHRTIGATFRVLDYQEAMTRAKPGDLVYCDPPYSHAQPILYRAQQFSLQRLLEVIGECKFRGVYVALSIDGTKKSGDYVCDLPIPAGLFKREILISAGRSMLRRFQMGGQTLEKELVADRLMLTW